MKTGMPTRRGAANLELVLVTAFAVPLGIMLLLLAVRMTVYVFGASSGMITMPWL